MIIKIKDRHYLHNHLALEICSLVGSIPVPRLKRATLTSGPKAAFILSLTVSITTGFFKISFSIILLHAEHTLEQLRRSVRLSWAIFVIMTSNGRRGKWSQLTCKFSFVIVWYN